MNPLRILLSISALLISASALALANSSSNTFLTLRSEFVGFSNNQIGILTSSMYIGMLLCTILGPRIINRVGHIRAFTCFSAIMTLGLLGFVDAGDNILFWAGLRFVIGFSVIGSFMITESWLNTRASTENRAKVLSIYMMIYYLTSTGGQMLISIADTSSVNFLIHIALLTAFAVIPISLTRARNPLPLEVKSRFSLKRLWEISPMGAMGCFIAGLLIPPIYGLGPVFAKESGLDSTQIAWFMTIFTAAGFLVQYPVGYLSDRFDRRLVIFFVTLLCALASFGVAFYNSSYHMLLTLTGFLGGFSLTFYPLLIAYVIDYVDKDDMVNASAMLNLIWGLGSIIGPITAAASMSLLGKEGLFLHSGVVMTFMVIIIAYRARKRTWSKIRERVRFIPVSTHNTAAISQLDPRLNPKEDDDQGNK